MDARERDAAIALRKATGAGRRSSALSCANIPALEIFQSRIQLVKKALLQGVPSPAGDGIKYNPVISGDMRVGNDTSREIFADNFARNRGENFVPLQLEKVESHFSNSKKWLATFSTVSRIRPCLINGKCPAARG